MQLVQLLLPSLATIALGSALLAPHRAEAPKPPRTPRAQRPSRTPAHKQTARSNSPSDDAVTGERVAEFSPAPAGEATRASRPEQPSQTRGSALPAHAASRHAAALDTSSAVAALDADRDPAALDANRDPAVRAENGDERSLAGLGDRERVVPLTRLRLRPRATSIGWPALLDPARSNCGSEERLLLLRSIDAVVDRDLRERALLQALDEEDGELRVLALRALTRAPTPAAGDAFADALLRGSDDERAVAVDGLLALGRRAELLAAFEDRVEAVAAKAALAYVGTRRRDDFRDVLDAHVEPSRRDAILALLAGSLE
jgi:hypothetical protein